MKRINKETRKNCKGTSIHSGRLFRSGGWGKRRAVPAFRRSFTLFFIFAGLIALLPLAADNRLVYGDLDRVTNLNPITGGNNAEKRLQQFVFNGLLQVRRVLTEGGTRSDLNHVGVLAQDHYYDSQNDEYIFSIRPGVIFHNGFELTAFDVVATINMLIDPRNDVGTDFYRKYIERCSLEDYMTVRIKLKKQPFIVWDLFTFGIASDPQLSALGAGGLNKDAQGRKWWNLDFINQPAGTGPFQLTQPLQIASVMERIELERFDEYFEMPPSAAGKGNIDSVVYQSYAASTMSTLMEELQDESIINFTAQSYGVDTSLYHTINYGNNSIYYIGFNFRPDRNIHVIRPGKRIGQTELVKVPGLFLGDILNSTDTVTGVNAGVLFRRLIMQGLDRVELLRRTRNPSERAVSTAVLEQELQKSLFPVNSVFDEKEEVQQAGDRYLPSYTPEKPYNQLSTILDRYLNEQGKPYFRFVYANDLQELIDREAVREIADGLFMSSINPSSNALSLRMIYLTTDRAFYDYQTVSLALEEQFAQMGIVLRAEGIHPAHFEEEIEKGEWDLVFTSYVVPADYNITAPFSKPVEADLFAWETVRNYENVMFFQDNYGDRLVEQMENQASRVSYAEDLMKFNELIMEKLPMIPLFGMPQSSAFRQGLFETDIEQLRRYANSEYLFDFTERWEMR